ncbi:hypothetical protein FDECE_11291 [Fusarium decemcellulare]|nr:hypothetical protein FDECE_11291 [Fusarium decemcellulare]
MPQTATKNGPKLGIRLDRADQTYIPGETLTGHVYRKDHIVTSKATLHISLHARSKSRMVANRGHLTSTYRGRFDLIKSAHHTQTIFQGPLHITVDGREQNWRFAVKLPTHVDLSALGSGAAQNQSYVSLDAVDVLNHRLPPTFLAVDYQYLSGMSAFVEYFLRAELKDLSRGSTSATEALLPFKLLYLNSEPLDAGPPFHTSRYTRSILSRSLITEATNTDTVQQSEDLSGCPTVPNLVFEIQVQSPTVLMINSPNPVPFSVLAIPDLTKSRNGVQYSSHEVRITHLSIKIVAKTEIKCSARKTTHQAESQEQIDLSAEDAYRRFGNALIIPWEGQAAEVQASQGNACVPAGVSSGPLNVGEKIGLRLGRNENLYATFQTYNIQHTHKLKWKMTIRVAEKSFELSGEDTVRLITSPELERSTDWVRPPSEDRLPSFSEYQEELVELDVARTSQGSDAGGVGGLSRLWVL